MFEFSLPHLLVVLAIFLLVFGPSRLGDLGSSLGNGIKGFKRAMREPDEIDVTLNVGEQNKQAQGHGLEEQGKTVEK